MEKEDPVLNDFLNEVCQYMESWHSYANVMHNFSLDEVCTEPYADFKKLLKLFYRALDPLHKEWLRVFFTQCILDSSVAKALLNAHYFKLKQKSKNIYICFLYLCSFTYSLLQYCERNGVRGMLNQIRELLPGIFSSLQPRFTSEGGWDGLRKLSSLEMLPTILQFISNCYCEKAIFSTFVVTPRGVLAFGLHGKEAIDLLLNNAQAFEDSVRGAFEREINANFNYKQEIDRAFLTLRSNLERGPFYYYLLEDQEKIAVDPTSPLSRI